MEDCKEIFEKIIFKEDFEYVMKAIKEVHNEETGWVIEEPTVQQLSDGRIKISVLLIKKREKSY